MDVSDVVVTHLPTAVVASLLLAAFDVYTGEITSPSQLGIDVLVHSLAFFVGFVVIEAVWKQVFSKEGL
ncbi:hypothetical protein LPA44_15860 [Halobacterium sp. KA-4]|uniref:hypothetical protein n=1 Tax=Halobacterium sp. KA-4 TaxID=2896367 RepID=UPI001E340BD7|nr:hypothetical protein [Halobacterium sp. KA-4]MCD2201347.1 hypothetical protein [Halobacterium sp. KA-4]